MSATTSTTRTHISGVMCTRNRPDSISAAVESVLANAFTDFDLLVVDQSTDDRTGEIVRGLAATDPRLRYRHTSQAGLSRAYNIGIRETPGPILAFTDDDCIAPINWLASIEAAFAAEPSGDLLYGQVLVPDALADRANWVPTLKIRSPWSLQRNRTPFVLYGMGANFAARRRLFERIGLFDEVLGGGGPLKSSQDFDLQYRAYVGGATTFYRPEVKVDHYGIRSDEQWISTNRAYGTGDGAFWTKHVRCGDRHALFLLGRHLVRMIVREVLHRSYLRRTGHSQFDYLRGVAAGVLGSFAFAVDRRSRLYVNARPGAGS